MEVDGHRRDDAAKSARAQPRQRQTKHREQLPSRIVEECRILPDVHVAVMIAVRRHDDRSVQNRPLRAHLIAARIARPGGATFASLPPVTTGVPATSTWAMPSGCSDGR